MKRSEVSTQEKLKYLSMAIEEIYRMKQFHSTRKPKTDIIGYACQFTSYPKLKREDFELMLNMTIGDIIKNL